MVIEPFSVPEIWMPTRFRDVGTEPGTRCNLAGCENYLASYQAVQAVREASADLLIDHWNSQDTTLRRQLGDAHGVGIDRVLLTSGATGAIRYAFEVFAGPDIHMGLLLPDWPASASTPNAPEAGSAACGTTTGRMPSPSTK
ncbi:hypothetical protein [Streptomyces sp. CA-132043]|uniref:hypothetical protein n=1 Tax=Streptomyces sp. CA-132043 TaxID=3240048 RepID=UPI003D8A8C88